MSACYLGIDLGGSSVKAAVLTETGEILSRRHLEFRADEEMDWADAIRQLVGELYAEQRDAAFYIALSAPGLASSDGRSIACMPGRLAGLVGLNWTEYLGAPSPVPVLNDAHAALLGEAWLGAAAGLRDVFMLTLGTGVGGAAMVDGHLLRGHIGRAGHLGHICLDPHGTPGITRIPGSLEEKIGNCSILERSGGRFRSTHDLVAAHIAGNIDASRIWLESIRALACGVASLVNVLDPEAVVIGGGIARAGAVLFEPLQSQMELVEWRPLGQRIKILPAKLGEFAGAIGAASRARQS